MSANEFNPYDKPGEVDFSADEPTKKPRGCLFYGCITALVLAVLGLILMLILAYVAYSWTNKTIKEYTSTTPVAIPKVEVSAAERKSLDDRLSSFKAAIDKGEAAELTLTADDINAWIDEQQSLKGTAYVTIKGEKISAQLSYPLDAMPFGLGKGRYFNGSATLTVSLHDGDLVVHAKGFQVNGKSPPGDFMDQFSHQNLAKDWNNNPQNAEMISHFESIEIKDGKVHLKARSKAKAKDDARDEPKTGDTKAEPKDDDAKETPKAEPRPGDTRDTPKVDPASPRPGEDEPKGDDAPAEKKAA